MLFIRCERLYTWIKKNPGWVNIFVKYAYMFAYIYIYIYIYIVIHWQNVSFSVARPVRCFKPSSKPGWLYVSRISYPRSRNFFKYIFLHMHYRLPVCSVHDKSIAFQRMWQPANSLHECSTNRLGVIFIVSHWQAFSWYHNSSEWLDLRNASSWVGNPADFTSIGYLLYIYIYIYI